VRVLYNHSPRFVLGPLGLYERGQRLEIEGKEVVVTNVDHDGAGVAFLASYIQEQAEREGKSFEQMVKGKFARYRTGAGLDYAREYAQGAMTRTILFNRRAAGLDETDPRELKEPVF